MANYEFFIQWMDEVPDVKSSQELNKDNADVFEFEANSDEDALNIAYSWAFQNDWSMTDSFSRLDRVSKALAIGISFEHCGYHSLVTSETDPQIVADLITEESGLSFDQILLVAENQVTECWNNGVDYE